MHQRFKQPGDTSPAGFVVVDKPEGISSMAAVASVRRHAGGAKCGHAGTLDPLATGVLVVGIGRAATKHLGSIMSGDKQYETEIDLSCFTTTDDREGERIECDVVGPIEETTIREAIAGFIGAVNQRPPAFSAIKVDGKRAYLSARQGGAIELSARMVRCDGIEILSFEWPRIRLNIRCGKGFYVRSLARELGEALGTGGYCLSIRRTAVWPFTINEATPLDELPDRMTQQEMITVEDALSRIPPPSGK